MNALSPDFAKVRGLLNPFFSVPKSFLPFVVKMGLRRT